MDTIKQDIEYSIELGETCSDTPMNSQPVQYHSLMYKFKPKSIKENNWDGKFEIITNNNDDTDNVTGVVNLTVNNNNLFKGKYEEKHNKQTVHECLLIFDKHTQTFRLERLYAVTGGLSSGSNSSVSGGSVPSTGVITTGSASINTVILPQVNTGGGGGSSGGGGGSSGGGGGSSGGGGGGTGAATTTIGSMRSSTSSGSLHGTTQLLQGKTTPPKKTPPPTHSLELENPQKKRKEETIVTQQPSVAIQQPMSMSGVQVDTRSALESDSDSSDSDSDSDSASSDSESSDSASSDSD